MAGKIVTFVGAGLVLVLIAALKFGAASFISNLLDDKPSGPADPWEGTAAALFTSGEEGLVMPTPTAVEPFTLEEVTAALGTVKQALVAGRLDESMLYDHELTSFEALFSDFGREDLDVLINDDKVGPAVLTWIAPGHTLVDNGIRFKGEVTVKADVDSGISILVVESNFVWVYAFTGDLVSPGDHLVTIRDRVAWTFPKAEEVIDEYIGMYVGAAEYSASGIDCDLIDQDFIALGPPVFTDVDVDPDAAFDPDGSMDVPDELSCD
jgi:hypothetical protein